MGRLQTKVARHKYTGCDRLLTQQFIGGLSDKGMTDEILKEVAMLEDIEEATSDPIFTWVHRVEVQSAERIVLSSIKDAEELDAIWKYAKKHKCETMHGTNASIVGQNMYPSCALHIGRHTENVAKPTSSRWSADHHGDNWLNWQAKRVVDELY